MLSIQPLLTTAGMSVMTVECDGQHAGWSREEALTEHALVLVRAGAFRRRVESKEILADASFGYFERPGLVQQVQHPHGGDTCTVITFAEPVLGSPTATFPISPAVDLAHRMLLNRFRNGADVEEMAELMTVLVGHVLDAAEGCQATPPSERLANAVREALAERPEVSLDALAALLGASPYRLSRAFKASTGITISEHRMRLRSRVAMDRIAGGDANLAAVALDAGFSDQAHMTRTLRRQLDMTPGTLRQLLS